MRCRTKTLILVIWCGISGSTPTSAEEASKSTSADPPLQRQTGQVEHVVVHVTVAELSQKKIRDADIQIPGIDAQLLSNKGISGLLAEGAFQRQNGGEVQSGDRVAGDQPFQFAVLDNSELLEQVVVALQNKGALKILANPSISTTSGQPATLHAGGEIPIQTPVSAGETTTRRLKFGTEMYCLPVVLGDGKVRLQVRPRVSRIDQDRSVTVDGVLIPALDVREVDIAVELDFGQTYVLAGLVRERTVSHRKRLSEFLGLAKPPQPKTERTELVVTVRCEPFAGARLARQRNGRPVQ